MCIGGPKLLRQGRVKAAPRPRQGQAKAAPRRYTKKTDYRRPQRVPPELILELLDTNFAALALIFDKIFVNLSFFKRILMILLNYNRFWMNFNMV